MAVGSFSAGLSGLAANSNYLRVIGNNLANLNTVGFKTSMVTFSDLVSQNIGGSSMNPMQVGLGVATASISPIYSQGAIESTPEPTNVAIQGGGFFILNGQDGATYTRAGDFTIDNTGRLVNPQGLAVQGYTATNANGTIITTGALSDIVVPPGVLRAPVATTSFQALTNLDTTAANGDTFTTSVQLYDSLGTSHVATITYTKTAASTWTYDLTVPGDEITGGTPGTPYNVKSGTLVFGADGTLSTVDAAAPADIAIATPTWTNGAAASALTWDLVNANGVSSITGYATASATSSVSQDGSPAGQISNISIASDGTIQATFGAGQTVAVGQLALASFNNPKGLIKVGLSQFAESESAGTANVGVPGAGGRGTVVGSALEQSNVDIALEFTAMIAAQRGYQANAKSITVADDLLVETVNLKR